MFAALRRNPTPARNCVVHLLRGAVDKEDGYVMNRKMIIQEKAFRTMFLWLLWAAVAVAVHFSMYFDLNLWEYIKQDESKVTWITYGLFFLGIIMSFALMVRIITESILATRLGYLARDNGLIQLPIAKTSKAVERFFLSLKEIALRNDQADIEALLDVELAPYRRISHAVDVFGNLLITLGLIGTVVGLIAILAGLTTSMDALGHDQDRLLAGIRHAMGGMGTSFYATLLGSVLGGLLLRVFVLINDHGIDELSENLKKICMVYCSADAKPTLERELRFFNIEIAALGNNVKLLQAAFQETKNTLADFKDHARELHKLGSDEDGKQTLRDSVVLQQYYTDLLKEEIRVMNKINRSWWARLKRSLKR
jgi:hypothetical protein